MKSIMQTEKYCYLTKKLYGKEIINGLEEHHIFFGTANRRVSEKNGFKVWLAPCWHEGDENGNKFAAHHNIEIDWQLKKDCQRKFEESHTREEFMRLIGRNYIND